MAPTKFFNMVYFIGAIVASTTLACQLIIITVNVIMRYGFNSGISWMEEISKDVLMTAFTFLSMAIGVKLDLHIHVDIIPRRSPPWVNFALRKLKYLIIGVIGLVLLWYGTSLLFSIKASIASLPFLPAWLQFVTIPLSGFLILYDSVMSLLGLEKSDDFLDRIFMSAGGEHG